MLTFLQTHVKSCLKVGNWLSRACLPWPVPSRSMSIAPPYARSDGLSCSEGPLCWNKAPGVGGDIRGEYANDVQVAAGLLQGWRAGLACQVEPSLPPKLDTAQMRWLAQAVRDGTPQRYGFASGLCGGCRRCENSSDVGSSTSWPWPWSFTSCS